MKKLTLIIMAISLNTANATCEMPQGLYTSRQMVLDQFVLDNATPNWGDWCLEVNSFEQNNECNTELDKWKTWLRCKSEVYEISCKKWADKENFASNQAEYDQFISKCVKENFKDLQEK